MFTGNILKVMMQWSPHAVNSLVPRPKYVTAADGVHHRYACSSPLRLNYKRSGHPQLWRTWAQERDYAVNGKVYESFSYKRYLKNVKACLIRGFFFPQK